MTEIICCSDQAQPCIFLETLFFDNKNTLIMKRILVPCDFSKPAIDAYRFALDLAVQSKGAVHLLHVIELPVLHDSVLMPVLNFEEALLKELKQKTEDQFRTIADKYKADDVKVQFKVEFGAVSRIVLDYVEKNSMDLIVMGSHGAAGLREIFIGSNAERIVRTSIVPVLVAKKYYKGPVKNIVFPNALDIEDQESLVQGVKQVQNFFKAHLQLVWINTPLNFASDTVTRGRMATFAKRFMLKNYSINIFNHRNEEAGIIEFTNFVKGDLIAIGTHGRTGLSHLLNGSLAEDVVNHNKGLVWTYANESVGYKKPSQAGT
jgi:nucleotide-binding universal stress UspA family protein